VPVAPKTFQVVELKDQQIKKSPLSVAARSKIINRSGSNYLSPWAETEIGEAIGYGPVEKWCSSCKVYKDVGSSVTSCPGCSSSLSDASVTTKQHTEQVKGVVSAAADIVNEKDVEIEVKVEQGNKKTGEYRSTTATIKPKK